MLTRTQSDVLTEEQRMIRDTARDFAQAELAPNAGRWEDEGWIPDEVVAKLGELGLLGMTIPAEWGGSGTDYVSYVLAVEEIAAGCAATSTLMSVQNGLGCGLVNAWGNEAQKKQWLPELASGRAIVCFCLTEPQAGSEADNLKTRATQDGDAWVLEGTKQFISNAKRAKLGVVFAVTDPDKGKKGLSAFLAPTDAKGFEVQKSETKLGLKALDTCPIVLSDCRLPAHALLGPRGKGLAIALSNLEGGRIGIAAQAVGIARAALEAAIAYAKERTTFGKKIVEHQSIANMLADMHTRIERRKAPRPSRRAPSRRRHPVPH